MSRKQDVFHKPISPTPHDSHGTEAGSDNQCPAPSSESDSESKADSRTGLKGGRYKRYTFAEKLAARTIPQPSGCWEVQGHALHSGHVQLSEGSPRNPPYIRVRAHVFAWEQANGRKVPSGLVVMHACDNPRCVNPAHLSVGTQRENIYDSIRKGRYNVFGIQKLNAEQVREIRARAAAGETQKSIGRRFNVARNTVSAIVNRKTWAHLDADPEQDADKAMSAVFEPVKFRRVPVIGTFHASESPTVEFFRHLNSIAEVR